MIGVCIVAGVAGYLAARPHGVPAAAALALLAAASVPVLVFG